MKKHALIAAFALLAAAAPGQTPPTSSPDSLSADQLGWKMAIHSYTFRMFSIFDAIDKTAQLGLHTMSISGSVNYTGSNSIPTTSLTDEQWQAITDRMKADGITPKFCNMGVVQLPADEAKCRVVFDFAKKHDIDMLVSEPPTNALDIVDKLAQEYNIRVAIHEHPKGHSIYWNPDFVLDAIKGRSPMIGACGDVGHWQRSGLDPLECIKKLDGHIFALHFKDLTAWNPGAHDVPWGTGAGESRAIMAELKRQNFHGDFCVEYEYHWTTSQPEIAKCVQFFNATADELVADDAAPNTLTDQEKALGWQLLWDGQTTEGWRTPKSDTFPTKSWKIHDGILTVLGTDNGAESQHGGDIITKKRYANFELTADFITTPGCNSGIKIFVQPSISPIDKVTGKPVGKGSAIGMEFQILDDERHPDAKLGRNGDRTCGSLYDLIPAVTNKIIMPMGQWNHARIVSQGKHVEFWLNGKETVEFERGSPEFRKAVALSKFKNIPDFGEWADGHILLQEHGSEVSFRNVKLRELAAD